MTDKIISGIEGQCPNCKSYDVGLNVCTDVINCHKCHKSFMRLWYYNERGHTIGFKGYKSDTYGLWSGFG